MFVSPDPNFLHELVFAKMPFGKHEGQYITSLPVHYLEWFKREGFPNGTLGQYLSTMYELKTNGIEDLLAPLIQARNAHACKR